MNHQCNEGEEVGNRCILLVVAGCGPVRMVEAHVHLFRRTLAAIFGFAFAIRFSFGTLWALAVSTPVTYLSTSSACTCLLSLFNRLGSTELAPQCKRLQLLCCHREDLGNVCKGLFRRLFIGQFLLIVLIIFLLGFMFSFGLMKAIFLFNGFQLVVFDLSDKGVFGFAKAFALAFAFEA